MEMERENEKDSEFSRKTGAVGKGEQGHAGEDRVCSCPRTVLAGLCLHATFCGQERLGGAAFPKASFSCAANLWLVEARWPSRGWNKDYVQDSEMCRQGRLRGGLERADHELTSHSSKRWRRQHLSEQVNQGHTLKIRKDGAFVSRPNLAS